VTMAQSDAERQAARKDSRSPEAIREPRFRRGVNVFAEGSVLVEMGNTAVLCTATVEDRVPQWMRGSGLGWVTAEYQMLPRATKERTPREAEQGRLQGRTSEIKRLIGRALRSVVRRELMGEYQIIVDCDVLQADGGTRTASVSGAFVALYDAMAFMVREGLCEEIALIDLCAAVSVGIVDGMPMLDLTYEEDSRAEVDLNVVMSGSGRLIEIQGTAEGLPFTKRELDELVGLAEWGISTIVEAQRRVLGIDTVQAGPSSAPSYAVGLLLRIQHDTPASIKAVIASRNPDKRREIAQILADLPIQLLGEDELGPWDPPEEIGSTVEENAVIKATEVFRLFGLPAIADDTALEVDALGGAPGVFSSRYAGEGASYADNRRKLLHELEEHTGPNSRRARFRTVVAAVGFPGGTIVSEGVVEGAIAESERGESGFGYDSIFVPHGSDRTFAEMSIEEKNKLSHRGIAFRRFAEELRRRLESAGLL
jgi:ribonuclease PH/non-canonical purine NTP pyrophosphatase (RdgB/HAM1 family)